MAGAQPHLSWGLARGLTAMSDAGHKHGSRLADRRSGLSGPDSIESAGILGKQLVNAASHTMKGEFSLVVGLDVAWLFWPLAEADPSAFHGTAFSINELSDESAIRVELNVPCHRRRRGFGGKQAT